MEAKVDTMASLVKHVHHSLKQLEDQYTQLKQNYDTLANDDFGLSRRQSLVLLFWPLRLRSTLRPGRMMRGLLNDPFHNLLQCAVSVQSTLTPCLALVDIDCIIFVGFSASVALGLDHMGVIDGCIMQEH
eukprot:scaffold72845_cov71-Attheya_sp.AAC.1